ARRTGEALERERVAQEAFGDDLAGVAHAAEDLDGVERGADGGRGSLERGRRGEGDRQLAPALGLGEGAGESPAALAGDEDLGDEELDALELRDRASELL